MFSSFTKGIKKTVCGGSRIRTYEDISQRIYSPSQLAALVSPRKNQIYERLSKAKTVD